ncbi:U5 small nuclear ribonucleoprotein 40 kDa protein [Smittium culicis]|uniref:U5 small nuclear ribonucleoprotein 40 kDa protein n=1 Tax=Smittium culicis TaxID=133412 RepID=A0A1R1XCV4_9FUNG|nr:U5 small nuclear ribonucleoprotein 40 kDa protein [Smittium culicis]
MDPKRKADDPVLGLQGSMAAPSMALTKRSKPDSSSKETTDFDNSQLVSVKHGSVSSALSKTSKYKVKRTSSLQAPNVQMSGHDGEVLSCRFSPSGNEFASSSMDKTIYLWKTFGTNENYGVIRAHSNAVLQVQWSFDGERLYSVSADKSVVISDAVTGKSLKRYKEHSGIVNSTCAQSRYSGGADILSSGSDDGFVLIWDSRQKKSTSQIEYKLPITSVAYSLAGDTIFAGSIDGNISAFDVRKLNDKDNKPQPVFVLRGHQDTILGLQTSPKTGNFLISTSADNTVNKWNIRPFAVSQEARLERVFFGALLSSPNSSISNNLIRPAISYDETRVSTGTADRCVAVWDIQTSAMTYKLPGHKGIVNQVDFHPKEPVLLSASSDKTLFIGELDSTAIKI